MSEITTRIKFEKALAELRQTVIKVVNLRTPLKQFGVYMIQRTKQTFIMLGKGGTFRGVTWKPFANQYVRKDGTVIPAWGGIEKVKGKGKVLGRLRPSKKRVTEQSELLRDTVQLYAAIPSGMIVDDEGLHIATSKEYGVYQQRTRPFLFFEVPKDINELRKFIIARLNHG